MPDAPPNLPPPLPTAHPAPVPLGWGAYVLGAASFIPLAGFPLGIVAIIGGSLRRAWNLVGLGVGGISFNVILYGSLFYFGFHQRGGVYDKMREQMAVTFLNNAVKDVEFYKLQHGHYPAALSELNPKSGKEMSFVIDPTAMQRPGTKNGLFFYELTPDGQGYFLRSVGADGIPFTADDILPTLSEEARKNTGLRLER